MTRYPQPSSVYESWYQTIMDEAEEKLTDWERSFIDSIGNWLSKGWKLTEKQAQVLERIYVEKTS